MAHTNAKTQVVIRFMALMTGIDCHGNKGDKNSCPFCSKDTEAPETSELSFADQQTKIRWYTTLISILATAHNEGVAWLMLACADYLFRNVWRDIPPHLALANVVLRKLAEVEEHFDGIYENAEQQIDNISDERLKYYAGHVFPPRTQMMDDMVACWLQTKIIVADLTKPPKL